MTKAKMLASLDAFTRAYIECALWSSHDMTGDGDGPALDENYDASDLSADTLRGIVQDCAAFQDNNADDLAILRGKGMSDERAGHDFWLTRNHHGAGFWDEGYDPAAERRLTDAAHAYGEVNLYVHRGLIRS